MAFEFNPGEFYEYLEGVYQINEACPNEVYPKFLVQMPGKVNAFWIEGKAKCKKIKPLNLSEEWLVKFGFEKITKENDPVPEYQKLIEGAIPIRFMKVWNDGRDYYYLVNPCMGPLFFESVHEVQRLLMVFKGVEKRQDFLTKHNSTK